MDAIFTWLASLPQAVLYLALAAAAATENFFPPLPADTVVAFGSFLAARGRAAFLGAFLAAWAGNVAGALVTYAIGRWVGAPRVLARISASAGSDAERRLRASYARRGLLALALSRLLPGVRALVPPVAGALEVPLGRFVAVVAVASGVWYGVITLVAYRVAANWEVLQARVSAATDTVVVVAGALALLALAGWYIVRRSRRGVREGPDGPPEL